MEGRQNVSNHIERPRLHCHLHGKPASKAWARTDQGQNTSSQNFRSDTASRRRNH